MPPKFHRRGGKWVRRGGKWLTGDCDCPCGGGSDCEHCTAPMAAAVQMTISGVVGCDGRCSAHNGTYYLPKWTPCSWGAADIFPQPDEPPGGPCAVLEGNVYGIADVRVVAPGMLEIVIHDGVNSNVDVAAVFSGSFSGDCSNISASLSGPTIESVGSMTFACPECDDPESPSKGWCDWSGATIEIEAL